MGYNAYRTPFISRVPIDPNHLPTYWDIQVQSISWHKKTRPVSLGLLQKRSRFKKWKKNNGLSLKIQQNYNTPVEHTPGNPPFAHYERNPFTAPVGKGCSGCVPKVCWNNLREELFENHWKSGYDMMTKAGKPRFFVQQISLCWYLAMVDCGSEKGALHDFICVIVNYGNLWIGLHCTWTSHVFLKNIHFDLRNNTNHVPSSVHCTHHLRWSLVPHEILEASARWACDTWLPTVNKWRSSWWFL